jgi:hypothetical protein
MVAGLVLRVLTLSREQRVNWERKSSPSASLVPSSSHNSPRMTSFGSTRVLQRQESLPWQSTDAWAAPSSLSSPPLAPPPPPSSGFNLNENNHHTLDYSIIDAPTTDLAGGNGFGGNLLATNGGDSAGEGDEGPWQLPRQHRVSVTMKPQLEGFILKHNVWLVMGSVCFFLLFSSRQS